MVDESAPTERIDKWLWYVRFYKTRGLSTAAVQGGHVRVNGDRVRPGYRIRPGDVVNLKRDQLPYLLRVCSLPVRRGPATDAVKCYAEAEDSVRDRQDLIDGIRRDRLQMPRTPGRRSMGWASASGAKPSRSR